eukprot:SAG31_NODE_36581_length_312_cov_0.723005_1_plen_41_part_10
MPQIRLRFALGARRRLRRLRRLRLGHLGRLRLGRLRQRASA